MRAPLNRSTEVSLARALILFGTAATGAGPLLAQTGAPPGRGPAPRDTAAMHEAAATMRRMEHSKADKTIALLLYDDFAALDVVGPYQMLGGLWGKGYRIVTVAKRKGMIEAGPGMSLRADYALDELPRADIVVVPGGLDGTLAAARDTAIISWIRRVHRTSQYTTSVYTGAWLLAAAGVLRPGDTAATHWSGEAELARAGVVYTPERFRKAGHVWTSAGVSAGMDMALALVLEIGGRPLAERTALLAQYDPSPPLRAGVPAEASAEAVREVRAMTDFHVERFAATRERRGVPQR